MLDNGSILSRALSLVALSLHLHPQVHQQHVIMETFLASNTFLRRLRGPISCLGPFPLEWSQGQRVSHLVSLLASHVHLILIERVVLVVRHL